jgi:phosphoribosylformylglycinamidine cyclo-ligase
VKPVLRALKTFKGIKALAHITGGGFIENIPRVLPATVSAVVDLDAVPFLPVFQWLKDAGKIAPRECLRTFNCGIGMVAVVAAKEADAVMLALAEDGLEVVRLGTIEAREKRKPVEFSGRLRPA